MNHHSVAASFTLVRLL